MRKNCYDLTQGCYLFNRSIGDDPNESPETKLERERLRRQANNCRERFVILYFEKMWKYLDLCKNQVWLILL